MNANEPILRAIDAIAGFETEDMAWLRRAGPIARRLIEDSKSDEPEGFAS